MKKQDEPGFIPGIYNYCDRWCEKCRLQLQCVSFVMGKKIEERGVFNLECNEVKENDSLWERLKSIFESTCEVLQEVAEERGMKVEDVYALEQIDRGFFEEEMGHVLKEGKMYPMVENSDILKICQVYEHWADRCLEKILKFPGEKGVSPGEDIEIVSWYLDLMQAKMRRALHTYYVQEEAEMCGADDYNGWVKVVLISIERSDISWKNIQKSYAEYATEIGHLRAMLGQLKTDIERQFPYARKFLRPGFERCVN